MERHGELRVLIPNSLLRLALATFAGRWTYIRGSSSTRKSRKSKLCGSNDYDNGTNCMQTVHRTVASSTKIDIKQLVFTVRQTLHVIITALQCGASGVVDNRHVRLLHAGVVSKFWKTENYRITKSLPVNSLWTLYSFCQQDWSRNSKAFNERGSRKICDFRPWSHRISETVQDRTKIAIDH